MVSREFAKGCLLGILVEVGLCMSWSVCLFFFFSYFTLSQGGPLVYRMGRRALACIEM